jgi:hypothetical protein
MLMHGEPDGASFANQLERARVTSWQCPCGCATIQFAIDGHPTPCGGLHVLGDYLFDYKGKVSGAFMYEISGVLAGLEVYALEGDAPQQLPRPSDLRPAVPGAT